MEHLGEHLLDEWSFGERWIEREEGESAAEMELDLDLVEEDEKE